MEKELLLKDLCARLPYKPRVRYYYCSIGSTAINGYSDEGYLSYQKLEDFSTYPKYGLEKTRVYNILPYLRPMSSMTEEEKKKYHNYKYWIEKGDTEHCTINMMDWLNVNHFDYRGLLEKGLALEAPKDIYEI